MDQEGLRSYVGLCRTSAQAARIVLSMLIILFLSWFQVGWPSTSVDGNAVVVFHVTITNVSSAVVVVSLVSYVVIFVITRVVTSMQLKGLLETGQLRPEQIGAFRRPRNNHLVLMLLSGLVLFWNVPHLAIHVREFIAEDTVLGTRPFAFYDRVVDPILSLVFVALSVLVWRHHIKIHEDQVRRAGPDLS